MIELVKQKFAEYLRDLGYSVGDNWVMRDTFPHLNLRVNGGFHAPTRVAGMGGCTLTVDIFSTYHGEKEILEIVENINDGLIGFIDANPEVTYAQLSSLHILDDDKTGPVREHGVVSYSFTLAKGDEIIG